MKKKTAHMKYAILGLILIVVLFKAQFLFHSQNFDNAESYYHLKQIENINPNQQNNENLNINSNDTKHNSFGAYHILLGVIYSLTKSIIVLKLIELIAFGLMFYLIYLLARDLTNNYYATAFAIVSVATMPIIFTKPNSILDPTILIIDIFLIVIYLLLKSSIIFNPDIEDSEIKKIFSKLSPKDIKLKFKNSYVYFLIIIIIIAALFSSFTMLLLLQLLLFLIAITIENVAEKQYFKEFSVFATILITEAYLFFNKDTMQALGAKTFSQNYPIQLQQAYLSNFSMTSLFVNIGVATILGGIYGIYYFMDNKGLKERTKVIFHASGIFAIIIAVILKVGNIRFLLITSGIILTICFTGFLNRWINTASKYYKIKKSQNFYWKIVIILMIIGGLSVNYSLANTIKSSTNIADEHNIHILKWVKENTIEDTLVVAPYQYGDIISYFANRKYLAEPRFMSTEMPEQVIKDINNIYTNINSIQVQKTLNKYNATEILILFNEEIKNQYNISKPRFEYDKNCFNIIYEKDNVELYQYKCEDKND